MALLIPAIVATPVSAGALTPDDALRVFASFMHQTDRRVPLADRGCDGPPTPADARSLYRRYLLDLPATPCARDTVSAHPPPTLVIRHHIEPGVPGHPTLYNVTIEVTDPEAVTAFGLRIGYPAERLRLIDASPGVDIEHWIAAAAVENAPGEVIAGGFDMDTTASARPLQLLRMVFEARGVIDRRGIVVRETFDDLATARVRYDIDDTIAAPAIPDRLRLHEGETDRTVQAIRYDIPVTGNGSTRTRLTVYDASGRVARVLVDGMKAPGFYAARWDGTLRDGSRAAPGVYYARLQVRVGTQDLADSIPVMIR